MDSWAACDRHLAKALCALVPADQQIRVTVRNIATVDGNLWCECLVPAQWFIKVRESE